MGNLRIGVIRATAIAAANAVMKHTRQGLFISEYTFMEGELAHPRNMSEHVMVKLDSRSNRGDWVYMQCAVVSKEVKEGEFPIQTVFITTPDPNRGGMNDPHIHFRCTVGTDDILVEKVDKSPYEE